MILVSACPMCLTNAKAVDHLLLNCHIMIKFGPQSQGGSSTVGSFPIIRRSVLRLGC